MPHFNIHWRGYPHRHLPRIRVASSSGTSVRSRRVPRIAVADSNRQPLGAELERQRKKQRFIIRRRRSRKSRSSSSAARARKHASLTARQHIQVFGWDAEIASRANTLHTESVPSSIKARAGSRPPVAPVSPQETISQTTVIDSHDGAGSSAFRCKKTPQPENLYSLMHVAEVPVYWTINKPKYRKRASIVSSRALTRASRRAGEYAHVGLLDPVSRQRTHRTPQQVGRNRIYDSRIDPRVLLDRERPTKSLPINPSVTTRRTVSRPSPNKSWQGNPELRRILECKVSKTKASPQSVTSSMKSIVQTLLSDSASRTPSQRKALKQFTKELELYLQAAKTLPKQSLVSSPSTTTVSAHTIEELRPFQSQFQSVGLAVTSADQRRKSSIMAKLKKVPSPPPTPPKDERYTSRKSKVDSRGGDRQGTAHQVHHHHKTDSLPSFDTGTTVMDFTLPHEQTGPRAARGRRRSSLSSDHTITAFTPPHEKSPLRPKYELPPPPKASTKRSLPWLRKPESIESSPSLLPKDKGVMTASTVKAKTRNPSDVLLSFSLARNSAAEQTLDRPNDRMPRELNHRNTEVRSQDRNCIDEASTANVVDKRRLYNDAAMQATPELSDDYALADQAVQYANATTQTDLRGTGASSSSNQDDTDSSPPFIKIKSKTFPTRPNKCTSDCSQSAPRVSEAQSLRKRYKDQAVQTGIIEQARDIQQPNNPESKRPLFQSNPQIPDLNRTSPFPSPALFQRLPAIRSPNKSIDEGAVRKSRARNEPPDTTMSALKEPSYSPTSPTPWPLQCAQCSAKIKPCSLELLREQPRQPKPGSQPDSGPEYEPEPKPEIESQSPHRAKLSHTCTARSSLECQQCPPLVPAAPALQREVPLTSFTRSPQRASCQPSNCRDSPARTTDWAATLEADLEEIIKGYHSPEERLMQRQVIQDTMDECAEESPAPDPVKRLSLPKLRLRPPLTTAAAPRQIRHKPAAPLPSAPMFLDTVLHQSETMTTSSSLTRDDSGISDRAVFRGLHVATAAACDEDVAKWIEEITGTGIRRFLADLSAFDGLGFNTLAGVARRAAKQRRGEVLAWERVREQRLQDRELDDGWEDCVVEGEKQGRCKDRKMRFMEGDETVDTGVDVSMKERTGEEVLDEMMKVQKCKSREGLRERAVRMGWRDRSVSGNA